VGETCDHDGGEQNTQYRNSRTTHCLQEFALTEFTRRPSHSSKDLILSQSDIIRQEEERKLQEQINELN
jgi:hypothetical protein